MIDTLPNLVAFARVVSAGSLSAAARELDLSLAAVSKRLAHLEESLGVRLIQRTTRRQMLTEEGVLFHQQVLRILAEVEQAEALMSGRRDAVSGLLRSVRRVRWGGSGSHLAAPLHALYPHGRHLAPRVRAFVDYLGERLREAWRWDKR